MDMIEKARDFAWVAHLGLKRKYTHDAYFNHLDEVAKLVAEVGGTPEMISAAYLHDTLEDTNTHWWELMDNFGPLVTAYVLWLTDISRPTDGNRAIRKAMDRQHLAMSPPAVQTIKLADIISNTTSIVAHDPKFAKIYLEEKRLLLEVMTKGNEWLMHRAKQIVADGLAGPIL